MSRPRPERRGARTSAAAAVAVLAVLAGVTGCAADSSSSTSSGPLVGPEVGGGLGIANRLSKASLPYPYSGVGVCVPGAEPAELRSVEPVTLDGTMQLDRVGVRPFSSGDGGAGLELGEEMPETYRPFAGYQVTTRCGSAERTEVVFQVRRTGPGDAAVRGFRVTYELGGRDYTEEWPVEFILCDPNRLTLKRCRDT